MIIGIISILVAVIIAFIPYARYRYFKGPKLTMEIILENGLSSPVGLKSKNIIENKGYVKNNNSNNIYKLKWRFRLIIRNNSDIVAYYPKIYFNKSKPSFTKIEKLNELEPLLNSKHIELEAEYIKFEECQVKDRTPTNVIPEDLKDLELLIESKNSSKMKFYTLYFLKNNKNKFLRKKPKEFYTLTKN